MVRTADSGPSPSVMTYDAPPSDRAVAATADPNASATPNHSVMPLVTSSATTEPCQSTSSFAPD